MEERKEQISTGVQPARQESADVPQREEAAQTAPDGAARSAPGEDPAAAEGSTMSAAPEDGKKRRKKPFFTFGKVMVLVCLCLVAAGVTWLYHYLSHGDPIAKTSMTLWLAQNPIAAGGCYSDAAAPGSPEAVERAIKRDYNVLLAVRLENGAVVTDYTPSRPLSEVLEQISARTGVVLQLEGDAALAEAVYALLQHYEGNRAVQSENVDALAWFCENAAHITRGQVAGEPPAGASGWESFLHRNLLLNYKSRPHYIAYDLDALPNFFLSLRREDFWVIATGVENMQQMQDAAEYADNMVIEGFETP